jgi:hypothetical protein
VNFVRTSANSENTLVKLCFKLAVKGSRSAVGKNINLVCDKLNFVKYCICNVEKGLIENTKRKLQDLEL